MNINQAINFLEKQIKNPQVCLPEEIFLFASRIMPLVNVDLLLQDEKGRTLLAWRDDQYAGTGWHIPGGIIRVKERLEERLEKVAETEIGAKVKFEPKPLAINEMIFEREVLGHFISFLFKGYLPGAFLPQNKGLKENDAGYLKWHKKCPGNLLKSHAIYKDYIDHD